MEKTAMVYEVAFDFTVVKKGSNFIGKSGVLEIETDNPISEENINRYKNDRTFKAHIANHLATTMKQKNIFMVTVKSISPKPTPVNK